MQEEKRFSARTRLAVDSDVPRLMQIINLAYRGTDPTRPEDVSKKEEVVKRAWTTESHLVAGLRTNPDELLGFIASDPACRAFFVAEVNFEKNSNERWEVAGCILAEKADDGGHLGMFAVDPARQALGLGRQLMAVAELHVWDTFGSEAVVLHVISQRKELLDYYQRRGYVDTGKTEPFPASIYRPLLPEGLEFRILKKYHPEVSP